MSAPITVTATVTDRTGNTATATANATIGSPPANRGGASRAFYIDQQDPPQFPAQAQVNATNLPFALPAGTQFVWQQTGEKLDVFSTRCKGLGVPYIMMLNAGTTTWTPNDFTQSDSAQVQLGGGSKLVGMIGPGSTQCTLASPVNGSPNTAQATSGTTPQRLIKFSDSTTYNFHKPGMVFMGFTVVGNQQGNTTTNGGINYHTFTVRYPDADIVWANDVNWNGGHSTGGAPPQECFNGEFQTRPGAGTKVRFVDCGADGRRADGKIYGGVGIDVAQCDDVIFWDCKLSWLGAAQGVACCTVNNVRLYRCQIGDVAQWTNNTWASTGGGALIGIAFNHEEAGVTTPVYHFDCAYNAKPGGVHVTFSNSGDGRLFIYNPTFNDTLGNGRFHITSWITGPYLATSQTTRPQVMKADGSPFLAWDWRHGGTVVYVGGQAGEARMMLHAKEPELTDAQNGLSREKKKHLRSLARLGGNREQ